MKVALDATPLTEPEGGIRRYTMELASALARLHPVDVVTLVSDQSYQDPVLAGVGCEQVVSRRWWMYGLPRYLRRKGVDVFHGTDFSAPYWPARPAVMTIHDLSPWRFPDGSARVRRRTPLLVRFGLASMILTPSEAVRREVVEFFGVSPEEVVAVPLAAASQFRPLDLPEEGGPLYFAFAGSRNSRKNLETVQRAAGVLRERGTGVELRMMGGIPEERLPAFYRQAVGILYPSLYEGFGLPVLEAMQCGTPVIASRDAAVMEVAGGACLHCEATDIAAWVEAMAAVAGNAELRQRLRAAGLRRAAQFSWEKTAQRTRAVYEKAIRRFHG